MRDSVCVYVCFFDFVFYFAVAFSLLLLLLSSFSGEHQARKLLTFYCCLSLLPIIDRVHICTQQLNRKYTQGRYLAVLLQPTR
jgi:hypothetical protein